MRRTKRGIGTVAAVAGDGFINVAVSETTRAGLDELKAAMGLKSQAEVIEKLVAIGIAINLATK